jgi:hypothetical protein
MHDDEVLVRGNSGIRRTKGRLLYNECGVFFRVLWIGVVSDLALFPPGFNDHASVPTLPTVHRGATGHNHRVRHSDFYHNESTAPRNPPGRVISRGLPAKVHPGHHR